MCAGEDMKYACLMMDERGGEARRDERAERRGRLRFAADAPRRKHGQEHSRGESCRNSRKRQSLLKSKGMVFNSYCHFFILILCIFREISG